MTADFVSETKNAMAALQMKGYFFRDCMSPKKCVIGKKRLMNDGSWLRAAVKNVFKRSRKIRICNKIYQGKKNMKKYARD
jgi:hypothetical protein